MGNCSGKRQKKVETHAQGERRKIRNAQDSFIRKLVDGSETELNEVDRDSVGPVHRQRRQKTIGKKNKSASIDNLDDVDPDEIFPLLPPEEAESRKNLRRLQNVVSQAYDEVDAKVISVELEKYVFPFENLVFEGGGNKGLAYCGAIRVLEDLGVWPQIKRFAGSSAGGMTASLLAVGYNSHQIQEFLSQDLSKIFLDHSCGYFSLLPNLIKGYGWNPGKKIYHWFGNALYEQTGNADITFSEVYERYGKELCIVVTNLNMMNAEYFHPKTTPDTPVRVAVRMSMAIPGLFQATQYETHGQENTYVDGGVLCNYPIHCYDGWWLSMKMQDSFLNKLQPLEHFPKLFEKKERFGTYNEKTLGFLLYADNERDILRDILQQRVGVELPPFPETKLAKEKIRKKKLQEKVKLEHIRNLHAVSAFLKVLNKHNENADDTINKPELEKALRDEEDFPKRYCERLFGKNVTVEEAMAAMDENNDGVIKYNELVHFIERTGVSLQARFLGYQRKEIKGLFSFFDTLQSALLTNIKRIFVEERDIERTVGINTGHVGTSDFVLEQADRDFAVEQGRRSTESFLRYFVVKKNPPEKETVTSTVEALVENQPNTLDNQPNASDNQPNADDKTTTQEVQKTPDKIANGSLDHITDTEPLTELEEVFTDDDSSLTQVTVDTHKQPIVANVEMAHVQPEIEMENNAITNCGNSGHMQTSAQIIEQTITVDMVNGESIPTQRGEVTIDSDVLETFNETLNRLSSHGEKGKVDTDKIALIQNGETDNARDVFAMEHTLVSEVSIDSNGSGQSRKYLIQPKVG